MTDLTDYLDQCEECYNHFEYDGYHILVFNPYDEDGEFTKQVYYCEDCELPYPKSLWTNTNRSLNTQVLDSFYENPTEALRAFKVFMKDENNCTEPRFNGPDGTAISFSAEDLEALSALPEGTIHIDGTFWSAGEHEIECELLLVGKNTTRSIIEAQCQQACTQLSEVEKGLLSLQEGASLPEPMDSKTTEELKACLHELSQLKTRIKNL